MTGTEFLSAFEKIKTAYKPDILTCLANLSNDEVFTPPALANEILDLLPQELFESKDTKFLDPACKSGVFLREIARRLMKGLEKDIPNEQQRRDHIFTKQIYGIAITSLTALMSRRSLYCSQNANGKYSVCTAFKGEKGNISFTPIPHTFKNGNCIYCGASEKEYGEKVRTNLESHAYEFIHLSPKQIKELTEMKFDVIIGNPPYQLSDGGAGISAMPIYDKFISNAIKLNPRYLTMIVPARWYAGGKGLDSFRKDMLTDSRIRAIHDFPQAFDCFPGVQIKGGVCYFLWDRDNKGECKITTHKGEEIGASVVRKLLEDGCDTFIRYNEAISILHKVQKFKEPSMESLVSSRMPFGLPTTFHGGKTRESGDILVYENAGISYTDYSRITKNTEVVDKYKVIIPRSGSGSDAFPHPILGKPFVGKPQTACSETYVFIGPFANQSECENVISYISTKFLRFFAMLKKVTQSTTRDVYTLVPQQNFNESWSDEKLYKKYDLSEEEINFIESMIKPMDLNEKDELIEDGADDE